MTVSNTNTSLDLNKNKEDVEHQRTSRDLVQTLGSDHDFAEVNWRENEALQACYSIALANNISLDDLPQTVIVSNAKNV